MAVSDPEKDLFITLGILANLQAIVTPREERDFGNMEVDAVVVFPGQGDAVRMLDALLLTASLYDPDPHFVYAGVNDEERARGDLDADLRTIREDGLETRETARCVIVERAPSTEAQARNAVKELADLFRAACAKEDRPGYTVCAVATDWHLPRAYLTLVAQVLRLWPPELTMPRVYPFATESTIMGGDATQGAEEGRRQGIRLEDALASEIGRIRAHQETGDVATLATLKEYLHAVELL